MQPVSIYTKLYHSPCGDLILGEACSRLCLCNWINEKHPGMVERRLQRLLNARFVETEGDVIAETARQLDAYFAGDRRKFDVPLILSGTTFQITVWKALLQISYGTTVSYSELARKINMPNAVRAVANANGANAISIFVPCHRVIGNDGSLTGYAGGLNVKKYLLALEKTYLSQCSCSTLKNS